MILYTSSYSKYKGSKGVQISNSKPSWATVRYVARNIFPDWDMVARWNKLKKLPKDDPERVYFWTEEFVPEYWNKLEQLGLQEVLRGLRDGDVLLCWCGDATECHRGILLIWLMYHGVDVREI